MFKNNNNILAGRLLAQSSLNFLNDNSSQETRSSRQKVSRNILQTLVCAEHQGTNCLLRSGLHMLPAELLCSPQQVSHTATLAVRLACNGLAIFLQCEVGSANEHVLGHTYSGMLEMLERLFKLY